MQTNKMAEDQSDGLTQSEMCSVNKINSKRRNAAVSARLFNAYFAMDAAGLHKTNNTKSLPAHFPHLEFLSIIIIFVYSDALTIRLII